MDNYDHLFNKNFNEGYFKSEEDREKARKLFNELMNQYKNYIDYSDIFKGWIGSLKDDTSISKEKLTGDLGDDPSGLDSYYKDIKKFTTDDFDSVDYMVEEYNLEFGDLKVELFKNNSYFVSERWFSKDDDHAMDMKYILTEELFKRKNDEKKKLILLEIIDNNIFNESLENDSYVGSLPKQDQIEVYEKLMDKMVEFEAYEKAASYRDTIQGMKIEN
jgi:hypothetical protein